MEHNMKRTIVFYLFYIWIQLASGAVQLKCIPEDEQVPVTLECNSGFQLRVRTVAVGKVAHNVANWCDDPVFQDYEHCYTYSTEVAEEIRMACNTRQSCSVDVTTPIESVCEEEIDTQNTQSPFFQVRYECIEVQDAHGSPLTILNPSPSTTFSITGQELVLQSVGYPQADGSTEDLFCLLHYHDSDSILIDMNDYASDGFVYVPPICYPNTSSNCQQFVQTLDENQIQPDPGTHIEVVAFRGRFWLKLTAVTPIVTGYYIASVMTVACSGDGSYPELSIHDLTTPARPAANQSSFPQGIIWGVGIAVCVILLIIIGITGYVLYRKSKRPVPRSGPPRDSNLPEDERVLTSSRQPNLAYEHVHGRFDPNAPAPHQIGQSTASMHMAHDMPQPGVVYLQPPPGVAPSVAGSVAPSSRHSQARSVAGSVAPSQARSVAPSHMSSRR